MKCKMKLIKTIDGIDYYFFKPTVFKQYADCYEGNEMPHYFSRPVHRIRMTLLKIQGNYRIYYMYSGNKALGHIVVSNGGNRIQMSNKNDIVLGPIWICPAGRGNGLGTKGIDAVLNCLEDNYQYAYEYIEDDNIASIKTVEKNGYRFIGKAKEYGLLKEIRLNDSGNLMLYKYEKKVEK